MVNSRLSYFGLSEYFWDEEMLTACYILNTTPNKRSKNTPYELWCKKVPNLSYLKVWGCRAVVRLTEPKRKTFESRDAILDEKRFTSIPRPRDMIHQSSNKSTIQAKDDYGGASVVPNLGKAQDLEKLSLLDMICNVI
uniref:Uncharacterized protein n=1 Tax=Lactuca sativa TaxID=4236 RepID=A0A9R1XXA8_LACSA|nr:hypothetical protein LSAT_V11C100041810 [Lactuca sativa]